MSYAKILGTAVNSSGSLAPVNAPVASAQEDAMMRALAQAQRDPHDVDFVELHATGMLICKNDWLFSQINSSVQVLLRVILLRQIGLALSSAKAMNSS